MKGFQIKFYMQEFRKHGGLLLYEWLIEKAKDIGIHGGSAFRAIAGFGRHGMLHEEHFFELASNLPVEVVFILSEEEEEALFEAIRGEKLDIFYVKVPVEYGTFNGK